MKKERFKAVPAVYLILQKGDEILLYCRANSGYEDGKYSVVAGHLEGDEPATAAMIREAKEEAGIDIDPNDLSLAHVIHAKEEDITNERIDILFFCSKWSGEVQNMEPNKCSDLRWFHKDSFPPNMIPKIRRAIELSLRGVIYSEAGW